MSDIFFELLIVFGLILLNGLFAMAELAIVSARKVRLKQLADEGHRAARQALELADDQPRFLSTVQIGITLVGVLAGAYGGATVAARLKPVLLQIPIFDEASAHLVSFGLVVAVITYLSLVVGELVPKRLALAAPERISMSVAPLMKGLTKLVSPFATALGGSTELVFKLVRLRAPAEPPVTDEEIKDLMEQGAEAGTFHEAEAEIVAMALRLGDRRVSSLMTPRTLFDWLDLEEPEEVNRRKIIDSPHSRFPLAKGGLEHLIGVVQVKDLLAGLFAKEKFDLAASAQTCPFIPETAPALKALELFKQTGSAMALVADEYGSVQGLITLNDILEALVGDIPSAEDEESPGAVQREDGSWLVDGILTMDELRSLLDVDELPVEGNGEYNTVGGLVMTQLKRMAKVADHVEVDGYRFEVVDMDGRRIDKVLVVPPQPLTSVSNLESGGSDGTDAY